MPTERQGGRLHYAWVIAGITFLAILAASGVRSSFGVFIKPLEQDFGWERGVIALAAAISLLIYGASGPLAGRLVDRYGSRRVLALSVLLCGGPRLRGGRAQPDDPGGPACAPCSRGGGGVLRGRGGNCLARAARVTARRRPARR